MTTTKYAKHAKAAPKPSGEAVVQLSRVLRISWLQLGSLCLKELIKSPSKIFSKNEAFLVLRHGERL
jgi:hypothetical protein